MLVVYADLWKCESMAHAQSAIAIPLPPVLLTVLAVDCYAT